MNKRLWLRVAVSALTLTALLIWLPWQEVEQAIRRMPFAVWLGVLAGFLAGHSLGVVKWRMLVNAGRASLRLLHAFRCYAAGLFANICLPSIIGGDVLRAVLAGRATGRAEAAVLGGIVDRMIDLGSAGILVLTGGALLAGHLPERTASVLRSIFVLFAAGAIVAILLLRNRPLARFPRRLRRLAGRSLVAVRRMRRSPGALAAAIALSVVTQSGFVLLNSWIGHSIGIVAPLGAWFVAWSLAKLIALLPISLGGLGVRDASFGFLLAQFGPAVSLGVLASLIWQSVVIAGGLVAGLVWVTVPMHPAAAAPKSAQPALST